MEGAKREFKPKTGFYLWDLKDVRQLFSSLKKKEEAQIQERKAFRSKSQV